MMTPWRARVAAFVVMAGATPGLAFPAPAAPADDLKPGFEFRLPDYPALSGYRIIADELVTGVIQNECLGRRLILSGGGSLLRLTIGVALNGNNTPAFVAAFFASEASPYDRLRSGEEIGLHLGDGSAVGVESVAGDVQKEIAFWRRNIFVSIEELTDERTNLHGMAGEIDARIASTPGVTRDQLEARRPRLTGFEAAQPVLLRYETTDLIIEVLSPQGLGVSRQYDAFEGDLEPGEAGEPDRYRAGGGIGLQSMRLLVYTPDLLWDLGELSLQVRGD